MESGNMLTIDDVKQAASDLSERLDAIAELPLRRRHELRVAAAVLRAAATASRVGDTFMLLEGCSEIVAKIVESLKHDQNRHRIANTALSAVIDLEYAARHVAGEEGDTPATSANTQEIVGAFMVKVKGYLDSPMPTM